MPDTSDLYTTLRNTSGASRHFAYLGRHGKTLAADAETTEFGADFVHRNGYNLRKQQAYERDVLAGYIVPLQTPRPILRDTAPGALIANPSTQATVNVTGGGANGGALAAGTYYAGYTWVDSWGQTTLGTGVSNQFTVSSGNIPRVTIPSLPTGATSANIYLSNTNGTNTSLKLYATGVSGTTQNLALATWYNGVTFANGTLAPTTNTTEGHDTRALTVANNTLGTADPSWGSTVL